MEIVEHKVKTLSEFVDYINLCSKKSTLNSRILIEFYIVDMQIKNGTVFQSCLEMLSGLIMKKL